MRRAPLLVALAAAASLLAGCSSGSSLSPSAGPTASAAVTAGSSISATEFAAALKLPGTVLLDVRTAAEFATGHLAGATNIDVEGSDFTQQITALDASKTYAVYCRSGNRSKAAMSQLQRVGISQVFDLDGGITAWSAAGGEIVK